MSYESVSRRGRTSLLRPLLCLTGAGAVLGWCFTATADPAQPVGAAVAATPAPPAINYNGWAEDAPVAARATVDPVSPERSLGVSVLPLAMPSTPTNSLGVSGLPYAGWQQEAAPPTDEAAFPRRGLRRLSGFADQAQ